MTPETTPPAEPMTASPERRWTMRGALRWFLAEFLVVVVGVLVALAVSAWWQSRQDRAHERLYLRQLDADLLSTEHDMHDAMTALIGRAVAAGAVEHAFWGERPAADSELRDNFALPWGTSRYRPILGNIEALISSGDINVVRSAPLRTALVSYVEWSKARMENVSRYDETYYRPAVNEMQTQVDVSSLRIDPYRKKNAGRPHAFDMSSIPATGTPPFPVDLDAVLKSRVVYNAYAKLMLAHRNQAAEYGLILERARALHAMVYRQLHGVDEPGNCQLLRQSGDTDYVGTCGALFDTGGETGRAIQLHLHAVQASTSGTWKVGETPATLFAGRMQVSGSEDTDVEIEASLARDGVMRTQTGWFAASGVSLSDDQTQLSFRIDSHQTVAANTMDIAILKQAKTLLANAERWDRHDDRECRADKPVLSLYCAMIAASRMQSGGAHHRRPALQIVRTLVDARSAGRHYEHRLRDYNNDPRTTLTDIQTLLDEAITTAERQQPKTVDAGR